MIHFCGEAGCDLLSTSRQGMNMAALPFSMYFSQTSEKFDLSSSRRSTLNIGIIGVLRSFYFVGITPGPVIPVQLHSCSTYLSATRVPR